MTLHEFLTARLDEEDRLADGMLDYQKHRFGKVDPIDVHEPAHGMWVYDDDRMHDTIAIDELRLKREIAAKRAIMRAHEKWCEGRCEATHPNGGFDAAHYWSMKSLASVYADHPDYQQEWKP